MNIQPIIDLRERINLFVEKADQVTADYWKRMGYTHHAPPKHHADYLSDKWCRIMTVEENGSNSAYAFICLQDGYTRALGNLKKGDIHKVASFKTAAKTARGNVLTDDFEKALTPFGIVYLCLYMTLLTIFF
jgi:hypothetical protein